MSLIEVAELTVRYGGRTALDGVSFAVPQGAVYALLGRNGAGKSSLVRCLLGTQRPAAGEARLLGSPIWRRRAETLKEVGVVPEEPDAPPAMTALQLSRFCSRLYPRWDGTGVRERLRRFGVPQDIPFGRLSKGQKGQVALTLALAPEPRLVVLDDPTIGLDALARRSVFEELIGDLADRGTTVFLTSHDLAGVEGIADRVGVLREGKLILDEELEALKRRFRRIRLPAALGAGSQAPPGLAGLGPLTVTRRAWGVDVVVGNWDDETAAGPAFSALLRDAEVAALTLEEIFVAVVEPATGVGP
jgi:ABC-type multidrug transport system ATPase subunit